MNEEVKYNLRYSDKDGNIVRGRRLKNVRRIELENGKSYCHSYMSIHYDYLGKNGEPISQNFPIQYETNINGFKTRIKKGQ